MGYGDSLIGTGMARGAAARDKRIAFGDRRRIMWSKYDHEIFMGNPNVARPGSEQDEDIEWVAHYKNHRPYAELVGNHWQFRDYRCPPGEMFFTEAEQELANHVRDGLIVIEPHVKGTGACVGPNKQWPVHRYLKVADKLQARGYHVIQFGESVGLPTVDTKTFRAALAILSRAALYIGPEGGLHHGCAAVGTPAVVIFGGFNTPRSTGYDWHTNIVAPGKPCGSTRPCQHCEDAMRAISSDVVFDAAMRELERAERPRMVS